MMKTFVFRCQCGLERMHIKKGEVNTSAKYFSEWVNSDLPPNTDFPSNMPRTIKLRTTISWLHQLGYWHKKAYVDGHKRADITAHPKEYLTCFKNKKKVRDHSPSDQLCEPPPPDGEA